MQLLTCGEADMEIEYEWCLVGYPLPVDPNDPSKGARGVAQIGDKLFVAGRYISDCGHPIKREIHPPAVLLLSYTEERFGLSTVGELVYLPWWYPGEVVDIEIYPPPRPSPDAELATQIPMWTDMANVQFQGLDWLDPKAGLTGRFVPASAPNHLSLRLVGRSDAVSPPIEDRGQLLFGWVPPCPPARPLGGGPSDLSWLGEFVVGWVVK
jgi:hypothetical protein